MKQRIDQIGEDRELRERLRQLRVDPAEVDLFAASLHRRLATEPAPEEPGMWARWLRNALAPRRWIVGPALGAAFATAVLLVIFSLRAGPTPIAHQQQPPLHQQQPIAVAEVELPASKVAVVRVDLSADVAVESATIRVALPAGLVFWSEGEALAERAFEWTQPLKQGINEIPIAVRGERPGRYRMNVHAVIGGEKIDHEIVLEVVDG